MNLWSLISHKGLLFLSLFFVCSVTKNQTILATYLMDFIFSLMSYNYCSINVRNTLIDNYFGIINFIGTGEERTKIWLYFSDVGRQPLKISLWFSLHWQRNENHAIDLASSLEEISVGNGSLRTLISLDMDVDTRRSIVKPRDLNVTCMKTEYVSKR